MDYSGTMADLLNTLALRFQESKPLLPMYLHLILSALFPIYTGAHASLSRPSSAAKPTKDPKDRTDLEEDEDDEETVQKMEGLTPSDAVVFPITAGCVLAGLYFIIKTYGADMINLIFGWYFALIGTYSVGKLINDGWGVMENFVFPNYYRDHGKVWKVVRSRKAVPLDEENNDKAARQSPLGGRLGRLRLPKMLLRLLWTTREMSLEKFDVRCYAQGLFDFRLRLMRRNVFSTILGIVAITYSLLIDRSWWLTNLQGFAVCYGALQLMSPTTFATGSLILTGLFFYDIWAVFFTPLMVTVAKNLDVPIKLVFPRPDEPSDVPGEPPIKTFSMLGLGDIVLPGIMIGLALRFDLYMFYLKKQKAIRRSKNDSNQDDVEVVEKVPYTSVTGHWGDKLLTKGAPLSTLPAHLKSSFPKTYFAAAMTGYIVGLLVTLVAMNLSQHAQPALLYLVPGVLVSLWGTGLVRGELKAMWKFTEDITMEPLNDDDQTSGKSKESTRENDGSEHDSYLSWAWAQIFGQTEKASAKTSHEASKSPSTEPKDSAETNQPEKSSVDENLLFSFKVSRQPLDSGAGKVQSVPTDKKTNATLQKSESASDRSSDDAVLVS